MKSIVIFDIDGTIADCEHRRHFVSEKPNNWKKFFDEACNDKPIDSVITILEMFFREAYDVVLMSGRPETMREVTESWLDDNCVNYSDLYMRAAGDNRPDEIVKRELFDTHLARNQDKILAVWDDRPKVIRMWRELGLKVFDCGDGVEF